MFSTRCSWYELLGSLSIAFTTTNDKAELSGRIFVYFFVLNCLSRVKRIIRRCSFKTVSLFTLYSLFLLNLTHSQFGVIPLLCNDISDIIQELVGDWFACIICKFVITCAMMACHFRKV